MAPVLVNPYRFPAASPTWASAVAALSPRAWYRLGESSGSTMADSSGNGHNGSYTSAAVLTYGVAGAVGDADTAISVASFSAGPNAYCGTVPFGTWMNMSAFTFLGWVKTTSANAFIFTLWNALDATQELGFIDVSSNKARAGSKAAGATQTASSSANVNDGGWHLVGGSLGSGNLKVYLDGTLANAVAASGSLPTLSSAILVVGGRQAAQYNADSAKTVDECVLLDYDIGATAHADLYAAAA